MSRRDGRRLWGSSGCYECGVWVFESSNVDVCKTTALVIGLLGKGKVPKP